MERAWGTIFDPDGEKTNWISQQNFGPRKRAGREIPVSNGKIWK